MKKPLLAKVAKGIATLIPIMLVILIACAAAFAQGGKAEPNRIEFKRGAITTIINGIVRGDEEAEYVLDAKKGQRWSSSCPPFRPVHLSLNYTGRITTCRDLSTMQSTTTQGRCQRPATICSRFRSPRRRGARRDID